MKILGIDYGEKRVGIAMSDENCAFAIPQVVLKNDKNLLNNILEMCLANGIKEIVMGDSKDYQMKDNLVMKGAHELKDKLEKEGIKVFLELEFMTSFQASYIQGENKMIDASAAAIILQSYLDKLSSKYGKL